MLRAVQPKSLPHIATPAPPPARDLEPVVPSAPDSQTALRSGRDTVHVPVSVTVTMPHASIVAGDKALPPVVIGTAAPPPARAASVPLPASSTAVAPPPQPPASPPGAPASTAESQNQSPPAPLIQALFDAAIISRQAQHRPLTRWQSHPDGDFYTVISKSDYDVRRTFRVAWVMEGLGTKRNRDRDAESVTEAKVLERQCLGILSCPSCDYTCGPKTKKAVRDTHVPRCIRCKSEMEHTSCDIISRIYEWRDFVIYTNGGVHQHRPPVRRFLSQDEILAARDMIHAHPDAAPSQLITGLPTLTGEPNSIVDIAPALANKGRLSHFRRLVKLSAPSATGGDRFLQSWETFVSQHGDIIKDMVFGEYTMVTIQTEWMARQALNEVDLKTEARNNGFVSDAAHKYFDSGALLLITSVYCPELQTWVPILVSYSSKNTTECHRKHFKVLFQSLREQMEKRGLRLQPHHINMVTMSFLANLTACSLCNR